MSQDYYALLGVPKDASPQDIKKAFRSIARECHPDVAGDDPGSEERFKAARQAYETLMDPVTRARYDRRGQRRAGPKGSFFDAFYNQTGGGDPGPVKAKRPGKGGASQGAHDAGGHSSSKGARKDPGNNLDLDDLFNDFGDFGFGKGRARPPERRPPREPAPEEHAPVRGADVHIELEISAGVSQGGGSVTAVYYRMQRADTWRPGAPDPGVVRVQDIADVRVIPGVRDGEIIREKGLGDAGAHGGPYGDLVIRLRVPVPKPRPEPPPPPPRERAREEKQKEERPKEERPPREAGTTGDGAERMLDISVVEAMLGGRVDLLTPQGPVRLTIPAGTSSGTRMRLKGKGAEGADLYVVTRIVVPRVLDEESRRLIEEFARLNPTDPRTH